MRPSRLLVTALLFSLSACKSPSPSPSPSPSASASASAAASASASASASLVDLLLETDAKVTVSSRVDNPHDYPEHLVDGRPDTAWNSKTGDLNGWIEVVLPPGVKVTSIAITAGFDKKNGADDLFSMNHRISKLRILRDGAVVKEASLDPTKRELQYIPIDVSATGGRWRIEVLETVPGTKKEWKELVVSDLEVIGIAGTARLAEQRLPEVHVAPGSAPPPGPIKGVDEVIAEGRLSTSLRGLCDTWNGDMRRAIRKENPSATAAGPFCREINPVPVFEGSLPVGWKAVHAVELDRFSGVVVSTTSHLVVEGDDGSFLIGPHYAHHDDLGCFSTPIQLAQRFRLARRGGQSYLVSARTRLVEKYVEGDQLGRLVPSGGTIEHGALVCPLTGTKISCPERYADLDRVEMNEDQVRASRAKPELRWPKLEVDGGPLPNGVP